MDAVIKSETWKAIPDWEGFYEVSDEGNVRSLDRTILHRKNGPTRYKGQVLKAFTSTGYAAVYLVDTRNGIRDCHYVHDLVLEAFEGSKPENTEVCHGPLGPLVNALSNLRYDTRSANALDRHKWGRGWPRKNKKPATHVRCVVCHVDLWVTRRRTAPYHLCPSEKCRTVWGAQCEGRK